MGQAEIGLLGLAVMGENLALNLESRGCTVAVWNRTAERTERFAAGRAAGRRILPCRTLAELAGRLERPRKVFLMVKAGPAVDSLIEELLAVLEPGDLIIDGGNSHFLDTTRRAAHVESRGLLYMGCGVSGGEEGALTGPSLMPGGSPGAWELAGPMLQSICAKAPDGAPCCGWVGENGAGHFVKMVHNGIEYGDMQLLCEAYQLLRDGLGLSSGEMRDIFDSWNRTELQGYLVEITRDILGYQDEAGQFVVEKILDRAGQKGTGRWAASAALEESVPLTMVTEAVFARYLSTRRDERLRAAALYPRTPSAPVGDRAAFVEDLREALYAARIVSYAQGYDLMRTAAGDYGWNLDYGGIALMWRGGCIIRSALLERIRDAYRRNPELENLLLDGFFREAVTRALPGWRKTAACAVSAGIPVPALSSALAWFDGYTTARLPANLLQAQRDYFGAHTYERVDAPQGTFFHTNWTGRGGSTAAGVYNA